MNFLTLLKIFVSLKILGEINGRKIVVKKVMV